MTKTKEGSDVLVQSKHFTEFVSVIKNKEGDALEMKAALWAIGNIFIIYFEVTFIGNIGASRTGFAFLEKVNAVHLIVQLADECPCLSVRG